MLKSQSERSQVKNQQYDPTLALINHYLASENNDRDKLLKEEQELVDLLGTRYNLPPAIILCIYEYLDIQTQRNLYALVSKPLNYHLKLKFPYEPMRFNEKINRDRIKIPQMIQKLAELKQHYNEEGRKYWRRYLFQKPIKLASLLIPMTVVAALSYLVYKFGDIHSNSDLNSFLDALTYYLGGNNCIGMALLHCPTSSNKTLNITKLCEEQSYPPTERCIQLCESEAIILQADTIIHCYDNTVPQLLIVLLTIAVVGCTVNFLWQYIRMCNNQSALIHEYQNQAARGWPEAGTITAIDIIVDWKIEHIKDNATKLPPELKLWAYHKRKLAEQTKPMAANLARSMSIFSRSESESDDELPLIIRKNPTENTRLLSIN